MDSHAHEALTGFVKATIAPDLDAVVTEVAQLRHEVMALRQLAGLVEATQVERRLRIARLRESGASVPMIAAAIGVSAGTVSNDLKRLQIDRPVAIAGLNGKTYRSPLASGAPFGTPSSGQTPDP